MARPVNASPSLWIPLPKDKCGNKDPSAGYCVYTSRENCVIGSYQANPTKEGDKKKEYGIDVVMIETKKIENREKFYQEVEFDIIPIRIVGAEQLRIAFSVRISEWSAIVGMFE
jgi:hypothetical protein